MYYLRGIMYILSWRDNAYIIPSPHKTGRVRARSRPRAHTHAAEAQAGGIIYMYYPVIYVIP